MGVVADPRYAIAWQGAVAALHSLALVNRAICARLARRGHRVTVVSPDRGETTSGALGELPGLVRGAADGAVDCFVAHQWPPDFRRPTAGPWVVMQPWEFGSIPRAWLRPLQRDVDELWVNCEFVRDCYVAAGVPPSKVHVIPLGVDAQAFAANEGGAKEGGQAPRVRGASPPSFGLQTKKRFRFLFVGGTLYRKGFDALLAAYGRAFSNPDDVCLVVKDMGVGTFYRGQTGQALVAEHRGRAGAAEV